ncbi:O-antigen ligase family protein [Xanthobacter wiegelii]|uniref:O-antigen ligase family protein n=1 Tax=Xanthobacter wiegelii TaxID=3119913 RepID=UPI003729BC4A
MIGNRWLTSAVCYLTVAVWTLAIFIGGGTRVGRIADMIVQIVSLPLLLIAVYALLTAEAARKIRVYVLICVALLCLMALQLVPIPPSLWQLVPGRAVLPDLFAAADLSLPWLPLTLAPHATLYAMAALIPSIAVFLGTLILSLDRRYGLLIWPLAASTISVFVGELQFSNALDRAMFSFYQIDVVGYAAGLFANRNHYAALNYAMMPLAAAWIILGRRSETMSKTASMVVGGAVLAVLIVGITIAYSRAGVFLGVVAIVSCIWLFWTSRSEMNVPRWIAPLFIAGAVVIFIVFQLGFLALIQERGVTDDQRQMMWQKTVSLIEASPVTGYGFGTFVPVYMGAEKPTDITGYYINHAHNDWLEIILEGGILAGIVLILFVGWVGVQSVRLWSRRAPRSDRIIMGRAGDVTVVLLLAHSLVEYPLRTTALAATFAACCALMIQPSRRSGRSHES